MDKTKDGKVYKNSYDIETETGLSYYEQKTAREVLLDLNLIEERYHRLHHKIEFIINQEELSEQWEELTGKTINKIETPEVEKKEEKEEESLDDLRERLKQAEIDAEKSEKERKENKKDSSDWMLKAIGKDNPVHKKVEHKEEIRKKIEDKLSIIANDHRWGKFIDFVYVRETENKQPVDTFLNWAIHEGFDPVYWTPEKCKTLYPRAFSEAENNLPENFVRDLPVEEEKEYVPMPDNLKRKLDLGINRKD
jgi:hypothetical protein